MKKLILAIGAILFVMVVSTNLRAGEYGRGRGYMMPETDRQQAGMHTMYGKLNLTADQKARIEVLRDALRRDIGPLQEQMFSKRGELKQLWLQASPDKEKILAVQKEIRAIRDQIQDKAIAHRVDVFNILTPEQQEKVKTFLGKRGPGPGGMGRGGRGMMGPGGGMMTGPCQGCN